MSNWKFNVPGTDAGAENQYQIFATNFAEIGAALGYSPADIASVTDAANAFSAALLASDEAKIASKVATEVKNEQLPLTNATIRRFVDLVLLNPDATPEEYAKLGITPASSYIGPVVPPVSLTSEPNANGSCRLAWNRSSNAPGTVWLVECSVQGGPFEYIATSTKTNFTDNEAAPGTMRTYRVRAQRTGVDSLPSSPTTIYNEGETNVISIAA